MTTIKFPRKEIEKYIKLTPEAVEKIKLFGASVEKLDSNEIELEICANRPDLISMHGFLRAIKSFFGKETGLKKYKIQKGNYRINIDKSVEKIRPYSMAVIVKSVEFTDERIKEIMQWQEKIHATIGRNRRKVALGYYILDKIKFPIKYIAKNPKDIIFEPLDMPEKMDALKILSRHPCGREYGNQLNGFDKFPVYYDANNEVLSMPPIINSNNSGKLIPGTNDILIECSGSDLSILKEVISLAVIDLIDMGGKAYRVNVVYGNKKEFIDLQPRKMKISVENANKLIGFNIKEKDLRKLLPKMGYDYKNKSVLVPVWRTDVLHEFDIIEDAAIAYGYDKLIPELPNVATAGEESKESKIKSKIAEVLAGLGLLETSSFHLIKEDEAKKFKFEKINLEASKSEYKLLRPNLLIPALRILSENKDNEYPQKIFEIGKVFAKDNKDKTDTGIEESEHLIITSTPGNFTEIKQILDYLAKMINFKYELKEAIKQGLIEGRAGSIAINNKEIGYIGEIHPDTLRNWGLKMPASVIEISLEEIFNLV